MIEYESSKFQQKPSDLFNDVVAAGAAKIKHRSRPEMVVMTTETLIEILGDKIKAQAYALELKA
jgi:hypothetical protein|tara:strand:- start:359 stop:550 length:192 start_codon:yes stop_codon:yes gene_type:complete